MSVTTSGVEVANMFLPGLRAYGEL